VRRLCAPTALICFKTNDPLNPEKSEDYLAGGNPVMDENFNPALVWDNKRAMGGRWGALPSLFITNSIF